MYWPRSLACRSPDALRPSPSKVRTTTCAVNVDAYELFLQARYYANHYNDENIQKAIARLNEAIAIDPDYAEAYALLAQTHTVNVAGFVNAGTGDFRTGMDNARKLAEKAVALNDNLPAAHVALGANYAMGDWDFAAAVREFERGLELEPNNAEATSWLALNLTLLGKFERAEVMFRQALRTDPLSTTNLRELADMYAYSGRCERAQPIYKELLQMSSSLARVNGRIALCYLYNEQYELAAEQNAKEPVDWAREFVDILIGIRAHPDADWRVAAEAYAEKWGRHNSFQLAEIYAWANDIDGAFEWLRIAREAPDPGTAFSKVSLLLKPINNDPRWPEHLAAAGLAD